MAGWCAGGCSCAPRRLASGLCRPVHTVLAIETIRSVNGSGRTEAEVRYVLSSCPDDPAVLVTAIRRHWSIENNLHWVLDVTFREDDSRVRERTAARNLAGTHPVTAAL